MKILFIIHATFEKPGYINAWAKKHGHEIKEVSPYLGEQLPNTNTFDFLIVMGGPQSPLKIENAPYLADEIAFIKKAIAENKGIIGICLGAQLIGEALGAKTERSPYREIGVFPVELLDAAKGDPVFNQFTNHFDVMHWHNDMPGIAKDAELLAKSAGCPKQIFRYGDRVYGFQCHFEFTKELVQDMVGHCANDLGQGEYVMTKEELLAADYEPINQKLEKVLDYIAMILHSTNLQKFEKSL